MEVPASPSQSPAIGVDRLAGAVAHAMRNPLAGALANLERVGERLDAGTEEEEALGRAVECVRRAAACVDDLVELGSPPAAIPRTFALDGWARAHGMRWRERVVGASRRLEVDVPADLPRVVADAGLLARAVDRLLDNAVEATAPGARIRIAAAMEGDRVAVFVADRGRGPAGGASEGPIRGLGLGLALVRSSVALFGASVRLDRAAGETRATLRLACAESVGAA